MKITYKEAKKMLIKNKRPASWFGTYYTMNIYRGCQHGCIYCDSRSSCYQIRNFDSEIIAKENAIELLKRELPSKTVKGTIGTGAMSDPYMPIEKELSLTRQALELMAYYRYPVHINTKSDLVLRDLNLLKKVNEVFAAVAITITTTNDELAKIIEPHAPLPSKRLEAVKVLSEAGIYVGILLMPILPFIDDRVEQVMDVVEKSIDHGAKFIYPSMGMTIRDGQREYFYEQLNNHFKGLSQKYHDTFGKSYSCYSPQSRHTYNRLKEFCQGKGIPIKMRDIKTYHTNSYEQIGLPF
ncbi:SPL family radical SAM protein [Vallitalea okinawensis]|uniref:SPL family radical SAM protein n=1 Tax=Vallitalea okinawensis TaxID=2078660 RepID=UPI000CFA8CEB|nr:radical SAM protein [Vallitalea okinawensis]